MPVDTVHKDVEAMCKTWETIDDLLEGQRAVQAKQTTYLPRLPGQRVVVYEGTVVDLYRKYLERAVLLPFISPLLSRLLGMIFRKAPVYQVPQSILPDMENITLEAPAVTAEGFAKKVVRENLTLGRGAIVVDWDNTNGRAYQRLYCADDVVNWAYALVGAQPVPRRIVLEEDVYEDVPGDPFAAEEIEQYRVLELVGDPSPGYPLGYLQHQLWREVKDKEGHATGQWMPYGDPVVPMRRGQPLAFIPVVPFNPFCLSLEVEKPPMQDLSELLIAHYRLSADYYTLLHHCGAGAVLFGRGFSQAEQASVTTVGGGALVFAENAGAALEYIQTNGQSGSEIKAAMAELVMQMGMAAGRLLLSQQKNVAESGAAMEMQFSGEDASLQQIAGTCAMALEEAMKIHVWWSSDVALPSDVQDVSVELNDQFITSRMSAQDVLSLTTAADAGAMTDEDLFWNLKRAEMLDPETTYEEWEAERGGEMPESSDSGPEEPVAEEPEVEEVETEGGEENAVG